ncbi:MAG: glycosyltransferase [Clostridia bacterium]|nr:glycosyltransferase [Clostridia bacterium]
MSAVLYIIVPCYNDAEVLPVTAPVFREKLRSLVDAGKISADSRILFVNDGSADGTWDVIRGLHETDGCFSALNLAHNCGEQNALLAGMFFAEERCDCAVTADSDLQDDINAVDRMLDRFYEGFDLALGVRSRRDDDSLSERLSSALFYKTMRSFKTGLITEHSNYRLVSRKAIARIREYDRTDFFLPALVCNLGLKTATVPYERHARAAGESGYNFSKRLRLGVDALFAHSTAPLTALTLAAVVCAILTLASVAALIAVSIKSGEINVSLSVLSLVWLIAAALCAAFRLVGEYLRKTYLQVQRRPRYTIDEIAE